MKIMESGLAWVHMAWYELILKLDGALWLRIISKTPPDSKRAIKEPKNKKNIPAETKYQIIKKLPREYFLLKLNPQSGRKHQIRQHCFMNGFPILGDKKYYIERNQIKFSNLFLHAGALEFIDMNNKKVKIETELPNHFRKYL